MAKSKKRKKTIKPEGTSRQGDSPRASLPSERKAIVAKARPQDLEDAEWRREETLVRTTFIPFLEQANLPMDVVRAIRLMSREAGTGDPEFTRMCHELLFIWQNDPPSRDRLLEDLDEFRDSTDAIEDVEWVTETSDWELETLPVKKDGTIYGYVRETYWTGVDPDLKKRFLGWFNGHILSPHDHWLLTNALLTGRIRTAKGFARELEDVLFSTNTKDYRTTKETRSIS